jgi:hypothetical protein
MSLETLATASKVSAKVRVLRLFPHAYFEDKFDTARFLPYTSLFVGVVLYLTGATAEYVAVVVGRNSSVPEHCTTEWDRRAAGMGRQSRKAE